MHEKPEHGFTAVDQQADPNAWVRVLDKLRAEPFYAAYKHRVIELLQPRSGELYLDVGAGTGEDSAAVASSANCRMIGVDRSLTMATVCDKRAHIPALVCDAGDLPFADEVFSGARADRTFQHLPDPRRALVEILRITKSGGRVITVDPDYGTQAMELPDQTLARRVLRYRADHMLRNGTLAHQMDGMFRDVGFRSIQVEPLTLSVRDPTSVDNVMGLRTWARTAATYGHLETEEADRWEEQFDLTVRAGKFLYVVTFFITVGAKP